MGRHKKKNKERKSFETRTLEDPYKKPRKRISMKYIDESVVRSTIGIIKEEIVDDEDSKTSRTVIRNIAPLSFDPALTCQICGKKFRSHLGHRLHVERHGTDKNVKDASVELELNEDELNATLTCPICDKKFISLLGHRLHVERHGADKRVKDESVELRGDSTSAKTVMSKVKCNVCNKLLSSRPAFIMHMKFQHSAAERPPVCCRCRKKFRSHELLKRHEERHGSENPCGFQCNDCLRVFSFVCKLDAHRAKKHGALISVREERAQCKICNESFKFKKLLKDHMLANHPGVSPFDCTTCGQGFDHLWQLRYHKTAVHDYPFVKRIRIQKKYIKQEDAVDENGLNVLEEVGQETTFSNIHSEEKPAFKCNICNKFLSSLKGLANHKLVIHQRVVKRPHPCGVCGKRFRSPYTLREHERKHTGEIRSFNCSHCDSVFKCYSNLYKHNLKMHQGMSNAKYQCRLCNQSFLSKFKLVFHTDNLHPGIGQFSCSMCTMTFKRQQALEYHLARAHRIGTACTVCGIYLPAHRMKQHEKGHQHIRRFTCSRCGKSYFNRTNLRYHEAGHKGERPFLCELCGRSFMTLAAYRTHCLSQMHSGTGTDRPISERTGKPYSMYSYKFRCSFSRCSKVYRSQYELKNHERVHSNERPFVCSQCGIGFTNITGMHKHERKHFRVPTETTKKRGFFKDLHPEEPDVMGTFSCPICSKVFNKKRNVKEHIARVHTGRESKISCKHCDNVFDTRWELIAHQRTHPGVRPYGCTHCVSAFKTQWLLDRHFQCVHVRVHIPRVYHRKQKSNEDNSMRVDKKKPSVTAKCRAVVMRRKRKYALNPCKMRSRYTKWHAASIRSSTAIVKVFGPRISGNRQQVQYSGLNWFRLRGW